MGKRIIQLALWSVLIAALAASMGCAATHTAARYQNLDAQTHLSNTVFLQPVAPSYRTVFVEVRNSTDQNFDIGPELAGALHARGWRIVPDPQQANFILQAYVLNVSRQDASALEQAGGMSGAGIAAGAIGGALLGGNRPLAGAAVGALAMGLVEGVTGSTTFVTWFGVMADVQVAQRLAGPDGQPTWQRQYTRVISGARQVNLQWETAYPYLRNGLVQAISGMF